jgi:hypothetical protein
MPADQERLAAIRRIHRILVGHTYGVARDAWADAVPHLRSVWEKHKSDIPNGPALKLVPRPTAPGRPVNRGYRRNRMPKRRRHTRTWQRKATGISSPPSSASRLRTRTEDSPG